MSLDFEIAIQYAQKALEAFAVKYGFSLETLRKERTPNVASWTIYGKQNEYAYVSWYYYSLPDSDIAIGLTSIQNLEERKKELAQAIALATHRNVEYENFTESKRVYIHVQERSGLPPILTETSESLPPSPKPLFTAYPSSKRCSTCHGSGKVPVGYTPMDYVTYRLDDPELGWKVCPSCGGTG